MDVRSRNKTPSIPEKPSKKQWHLLCSAQKASQSPQEHANLVRALGFCIFSANLVWYVFFFAKTSKTLSGSHYIILVMLQAVCTYARMGPQL